MSRDDMRDVGHDAPEKECKAFVGGISWHMSDRELKDTFRKFNAKRASVMLDKMTGRSRGFGFVCFDNDDDLKDACRQMHDSDLDGRKISCTVAVPQAETAPGTPASALAGGPGGPRSGRYPDRHRDRSYDRAPERPPPRGYAGRAYDDRRYDRGGYGGSYRQPERGYDRGGYPPADYDRGYDRSYPPPAYSYEREGYGGGGYGREPAGYGRDGYPPERGYSGAASYGEAGYGERSTYGSGYGGGGYDRGYDDRGYPPRDVYSNRGAAPAREAAYTRGPGPDRDYGRPAARAAGPYDRAAGSLPPR